MFQVVICDSYVLLALEGFPLKAKESPGSLREQDCSMVCSFQLLPLVPLWARPCGQISLLGLHFAHRDPSLETDEADQRNSVFSAEDQLWTDRHLSIHTQKYQLYSTPIVCQALSILEIHFL